MATWQTAGILPNPVGGAVAAGTVLADTGPKAAATYPSLLLLCWSTVSCEITLEYRNAANDTTVRSQKLSLSTEGGNFICIPILVSIILSLNERVRVILDNDIVGRIQCSIFM